MLILIDQDGVLADFDRGFYNAWQSSKHPYPAIDPKNRRNFYAKDDYPPDHQSHAVEIITAKGFYRDLPLIDGAALALNQLIKLGHDVRICTSPLTTYQNCVQEKYEWVDKHLGTEFVNRMIVTKDKTVVHGDILIDDKPLVTGSRNPVWRHILYDQPYNRHIDNIRMTWKNWQEILL
jgi:5'-nucleotidase